MKLGRNKNGAWIKKISAITTTKRPGFASIASDLRINGTNALVSKAAIATPFINRHSVNCFSFGAFMGELV